MQTFRKEVEPDPTTKLDQSLDLGIMDNTSAKPKLNILIEFQTR